MLLLGAASAWSATQPNILLIVADDIGAEASSLHKLAGKSGPAPMPNLEKLAAGGLVFDNVWVNPMCSPTRATILTGLYGHHTGVLVAGDVLDPKTPLIFDVIQQRSPARYDMAVFGKWHLGGNVGEIQHVQAMRVPNFKGFLGAQLQNYYDWVAWNSAGGSEPVKTYSTTALTDWAIDFIKGHEAKRPNDPWFVYLPYNAAHAPFQVPPKELHSQDVGDLKPGDREVSVRVYRSMIQALDTEMGRLLKNVDLKNTVVIYIGDNGTPANVKDEGAKVRGSKTQVWEGGARVSMVAAGAGVTRKGREAALVNGVDLFATVAALAGVPVTHINDAYSLTPLFSKANAKNGRELAFTEFCTARAQRYAIRDQEYKLLYDSGEGWGLFDLKEDISETSNGYGKPQFATAQKKLEAGIAQLKKNATKGCFQ